MGLKGMFVAMVVALFSMVLLGTFFPMNFHLGIKNTLEWIFHTFPIGWMLVIGALLTGALFVIGVPIIAADKLRMWYKRRQGRHFRKYDDPDLQD